ncbi:unnamed protein product [Thelazia callipaeda]|uniref:G_PROTEIN_RECEP_F2_4 domain-containing protein n=1 Tax=Thelazia callipaeda TaxID=103827 RepID=A0A0N5D3G7_THECL|nr:unnamed protein product [Thelazia callipaeda]
MVKLCDMALKQVWIIPFLTCIFTISAAFVSFLSQEIESYFVALSEKHITAFWPYISDSGTLPPESCIFGQLLNLSALFCDSNNCILKTSATNRILLAPFRTKIIFEYKYLILLSNFQIQIDELNLLIFTTDIVSCKRQPLLMKREQLVEFFNLHMNISRDGNWRNYCSVFLWLGYLSAFGMSMVGNFQEVNMIIVHYTGALLAFGCGLVYTWAQTVFSYRMRPMFTKVIVPHCRLLLCCLSSIFFITMIIFGPILGKQPRDTIDSGTLYKWTPESPNYAEHMIGTCSEWLLAICFELYVLSFAFELRSASCHAPKLKLNLSQQYQFNIASFNINSDSMLTTVKILSNTDIISTASINNMDLTHKTLTSNPSNCAHQILQNAENSSNNDNQGSPINPEPVTVVFVSIIAKIAKRTSQMSAENGLRRFNLICMKTQINRNQIKWENKELSRTNIFRSAKFRMLIIQEIYPGLPEYKIHQD